MKHPLSSRALVALLLTCLCLAGAVRAQAAEIGALGPMEVLRAVTEAKGKVVVVNFWASWCQPCRMEIPELMEVRKAFGDADLYLLGVSIDQDKRMYDAFVEKAGFNYPVGLANEELLDMFQVHSVPKLMVYDTEGRLVLNREGVITGDILSSLVRKLLGG